MDCRTACRALDPAEEACPWSQAARLARELLWRATEFAYAWEQLNEPAGARILDVGSPKDLAAILARHKGYEVVATDILPEAVLLSRRYAHVQGLDGTGPGRVCSEVQDGRALPYAGNSFDAAYSVSVLEHIFPSAAIQRRFVS